MKKTLRFILTVFIIWQLSLAMLSFLSSKILSLRVRFMYNDGETVVNPVFLWNRANFDGIHYLDIARKGYGIYQQAFFPLYPKLIKFFTPLFNGKDLLAAVFISNLSLLGLIFIFYKLVRLDYDESISKRCLIFFLVFPASFFLGMVYTESLFLMLILGSFYAARKRKWWLAGILGALAANSRIVGVFIFPALLYEWFINKNIRNWKLEIRNLLFIFIAPLGLFSFMRYLAINYHDPLMFLHVQPFFGAGRSGGKIILLYQVFWRYFKMILTTKWDPLYFTVWLEFLTGIGFLLLIFLAFRKKIRYSYLIFAILAYLVPTLSGTFLSMPRFALSLFPCFIYLGMIENKLIRSFLLFIFGFLFVISTLLFFGGYWIS